MKVIIVTPHYDPLGKGRGSGATSTHPLRKRSLVTKKHTPKPIFTYLGHPHPSLKHILVHAMIPEVWVHNVHVIVPKVRRKRLIPIYRLSPPIIDHRRGGRPLSHSITTRGWRRDKWVGGRGRRHIRVMIVEGKSRLMGNDGTQALLISKANTLNPEGTASE